MKPGPIQIGFRAEAVTANGERQGLAVHYQFSAELGSSRLLHCEIASDAVVAVSSAMDALATGQPMRLSVPPDAVHLFDATTGHRVQDEQVSRPLAEFQHAAMAVA